MTQQDVDFNYFLDHMEEFYRQYGHKFVVVKNQNILAVYDNFNNALETTLKTEEMGTFLIQECFDNKNKLICNFQGLKMLVTSLNQT
jgi:hypothetical protein